MTRVPLRLDVLVEMQDGEYVAHCLQLDIVATGPTEEQAVSDVLDLVQAQIDFATANDNLESIMKPAPLDVWQRLLSSYVDPKPKCERRPQIASGANVSCEPVVCYAH